MTHEVIDKAFLTVHLLRRMSSRLREITDAGSTRRWLGRDEKRTGPKATKSNGPYHQSVMRWSATTPTCIQMPLGIHQPWRRKRDSNPRASHPANGFQDRRFQPLTHSSDFYPT